LVGERSRVEKGDVGVTVQIVALLASEVGVLHDGDDNLRRNEVRNVCAGIERWWDDCIERLV
jgi:hypothetical protein